MDFSAVEEIVCQIRMIKDFVTGLAQPATTITLELTSDSEIQSPLRLNAGQHHKDRILITNFIHSCMQHIDRLAEDLAVLMTDDVQKLIAEREIIEENKQN